MGSIDTGQLQNIASTSTKAGESAKSSSGSAYSNLKSYFKGGTGDPRTSNPDYAFPLSRFGYYWKSYTDAYDTLYGATENYRDDVYNAFEDNEKYLDTTDIQNQWQEYMDRLGGYYGSASEQGRDDINTYMGSGLDMLGEGMGQVQGLYDSAIGDTNYLYGEAQDNATGLYGDARDNINAYYGQGNDKFTEGMGMYDQAFQQYYDIINQYRDDMDPAFQAVQDNMDLYAGYKEDWVRPELYDQWTDIAGGGAGSVEDFWNQSEFNKYLTDLGLENFNRQAALGGRTYNPYEVQDFIKNTNAQEMWTAFENLQEAGQLQPELDWRATMGMTDMGNQLSNLYAQQAGNVAGLSQSQAGLLPQMAGYNANWGNYLAQQGRDLSGLDQSQAALQGQLYGNQANQLANLYSNEASTLSPYFMQGANMYQQSGQSLADMERWYAQMMGLGDTQQTTQRTDLMNQQNQQMWQSEMNQAMTDANLQYMLTGQMPAQKIMDYRTGKTASRDMSHLLQMQRAYGDASWDWYLNATVPNALSQSTFDANTLETAMNAQNATALASAGISGIAGKI